MGNLSNIIGLFEHTQETPEVQLQRAMNDAGFYPRTILLDGQFHRFPTSDKGRDDAGWYVAYGDNIPAGRFGDWRTGDEHAWRANIGRELTDLENIENTKRMKEARIQRDLQIKLKHQAAASTVVDIWEKCIPANEDHPYLVAKGIQAHGARVTGDGRLVVPLYGEDGNISSVQYISDNGDKLYQTGGATSEKFQIIGAVDDSKTIFIAEGFATSASIREAMLLPVVVAYSSSNIPKVTKIIRTIYPTISIVIVADLDKNGAGKMYADQAGAKYGATVIVSPVSSDVNDFVQQGGALDKLLAPATTNRFLSATITPENLHEKFLETLNSSWVIKDIIPESSGLTMIFGAPGTYKSFISIDMALSMANGIDWHGKRVKQRSVLYIAAEGQMGVLKRFEAWRIHKGLETLSCVSILPIATKLDDKQDLAELFDTISNLSPMPEFIFFDTLARSMDGDENYKVDMNTVVSAADRIRHDFGIQIVVIHHSGKDSTKGARGSNSLEGATDTSFLIEKGTDDFTAVMTCERQKDDMASAPLGFIMKSIDLGVKNIDGDDINSLIPVYDSEAKVKEDPKKKKMRENKKNFERAWFRSGADLVDGSPYLTRKDWAAWLVENGEVGKESSAVQVVKSSGKGIARKLLDAGVIEDHGSGYILIDKDMVTALVIASKN